MARASECTEQYAQKVLDTADIVREAMLRQASARMARQEGFVWTQSALACTSSVGCQVTVGYATMTPQ